jgi:hypothetical protein
MWMRILTKKGFRAGLMLAFRQVGIDHCAKALMLS